MKKSAFISDLMFTFFSAALFTLCLFRYLKIGFFPALVLAILCGALASFSVGAFLQSKRRTYFLKKSDEAQKEKLLRHLLFLSDEGKTKFFIERLSTPDFPAKRFGRLYVYTQDALYNLRFSFTPVSADETLRFSRVNTKKQKILLCNTVDPTARSLAQNLNIQVFTGEQVYAFLKKRDALPQVFLGEEAEPKRKRRFRLWFSKSNARRFLLAAVLTLVSALVSPFPYYYILFGGILLLSALFLRIFGYE